MIIKIGKSTLYKNLTNVPLCYSAESFLVATHLVVTLRILLQQFDELDIMGNYYHL